MARRPLTDGSTVPPQLLKGKLTVDSRSFGIRRSQAIPPQPFNFTDEPGGDEDRRRQAAAGKFRYTNCNRPTVRVVECDRDPRPSGVAWRARQQVPEWDNVASSLEDVELC